MIQLLLFHCYLIITSLDPRLNFLLVSLQHEELLSKRVFAIMFFMRLEDLPVARGSLLVDFPCRVTNEE